MTGAQDTRLRPLQPGDAPAIQRIYSPRAVRFLPRGPMDRTQAAAWLAPISTTTPIRGGTAPGASPPATS